MSLLWLIGCSWLYTDPTWALAEDWDRQIHQLHLQLRLTLQSKEPKAPWWRHYFALREKYPEDAQVALNRLQQMGEKGFTFDLHQADCAILMGQWTQAETIYRQWLPKQRNQILPRWMVLKWHQAEFKDVTATWWRDRDDLLPYYCLYLQKDLPSLSKQMQQNRINFSPLDRLRIHCLLSPAKNTEEKVVLPETPASIRVQTFYALHRQQRDSAEQLLKLWQQKYPDYLPGYRLVCTSWLCWEHQLYDQALQMYQQSLKFLRFPWEDASEQLEEVVLRQRVIELLDREVAPPPREKPD